MMLLLPFFFFCGVLVRIRDLRNILAEIMAWNVSFDNHDKFSGESMTFASQLSPDDVVGFPLAASFPDWRVASLYSDPCAAGSPERLALASHV